MTTSGSANLRSYSGQQMLERALRQAGVKSKDFTLEMSEIAFDVVNTMFQDFLNLGIQLWARDQVILPCYLNRAEVPMPLDTSVVFDCRQRTLMRPTPNSVTTDQGGNAALAFDGDLNTTCVQTAINGSITAVYPSDGIIVTTVGINFAFSGPAAVMIEWSQDGIAWDAITTIADAGVSPGQWIWVDVEGSPSAVQWRARSVGPVPFAVNELYFGNTPSEIPMGVWNVDDYDANPVKTTPGAPWIYFQDRRIQAPTLIIWPVPDTTFLFGMLVARRRRYLDQVTDWQQTMDLSVRWYEFVTASFARRLCKELPEADMNRFDMLRSEEMGSLMLAQGEERDPAPERYNPGLEVYNF